MNALRRFKFININCWRKNFRLRIWREESLQKFFFQQPLSWVIKLFDSLIAEFNGYKTLASTVQTNLETNAKRNVHSGLMTRMRVYNPPAKIVEPWAYSVEYPLKRLQDIIHRLLLSLHNDRNRIQIWNVQLEILFGRFCVLQRKIYAFHPVRRPLDVQRSTASGFVNQMWFIFGFANGALT